MQEIEANCWFPHCTPLYAHLHSNWWVQSFEIPQAISEKLLIWFEYFFTSLVQTSPWGLVAVIWTILPTAAQPNNYNSTKSGNNNYTNITPQVNDMLSVPQKDVGLRADEVMRKMCDAINSDDIFVNTHHTVFVAFFARSKPRVTPINWLNLK